MVFPVVGGTQDTGYEISNSVRFDGSSAYMHLTHSSEGNSKTYTWSAWVKRCGEDSDFFISGGTSSSAYTQVGFQNNKITYYDQSSGVLATIQSTRLFRDPSAWYHTVFAIDTTQGTASNRIKIYVNGVQETSFGNETYPSQNQDLYFGDDEIIAIGTLHYTAGSVDYHNGYLADVHYIDGSQKAPTDFGKTNDNGVWVPIKYSGSFGSNGFKLEFKQTGTSANSSGIGADTSGNNHHFTPVNLAATDVTTDTPTNNFCTMNPLISFAGASDGIDAFTEGNTVVDSNNDTSAAGATFGVQNGKWYYEAKLTTGNQSSTNFGTGWASTNYEGQKGTGNGVGFMSGEDNIAVDPGGNLNKGGTGSTQVFGNRSTNDIFQVAIDLDNGKIWFGVNGTWSNGSATNSTTLDASNPDYSSVFDTVGEHYMPAFGQSSSGQTVLAYNFGNPAFSISSGNADANGYGNFEYEVPSGFYSLCTKNLAEFG